MVFRYFRRSSRRLKASLAVLLSIELGGTGLMAQALPDGGVVRAGAAQISTSGAVTRIDQASDRAIIDWRTFAIGAGGQVVFVQPSAQSATLNRVTGDQVSIILGRLDANGQVFLVNPNGIVFGGGAQINVGSLIASTSNLSNTNFMAGKLVFDQPGRPGAGILNAGAMTAAEGGLVALVASHVRNDGVIVARLGKVLLGAADTFTVDLYGDGLINLALSDIHAGQLRALNGEPVTSLVANAGSIDTAGGRTVLMTARNAKNVLDNLINMSGTIKADTAVQQGGRILLLGDGGKVDVSGTLSARGVTGGAVEVLGDQIHLASTTTVDASGTRGGGMVHVGGAFQGQGDTYRSSQTTVDAGATLKASAGERGDGGEVVVWSDGRTAFSGTVEATGGANGGNGGRLEVSGKGTLEFLGKADASASAGQGGSLLLDPAFLEVGAIEAGAIARVLRTGTSTNLAADVDITVNSAITGGDRTAGGGLTMTAGNNININDFVVTNDGAINLLASKGSVNVAAGKAVYAGSAPITVSSSGSVHTAPLVTSGALSIASVTGSVYIDSFIDGHTGPVSIRAAGDVDINQPIVNIAGGSALDVTAGQDVNVNALVIGRDGVAGGAVKMTAARDLNVHESIVTDNGNISLAATNGSIHVADGQAIVAGSGAVAISARGDITSGALNGGTLAIASAAGSVTLDGLIDSATGDARISAATDVTINQLILNGRSGGALAVDAGRDVNLNAQIDGRGDVAGGAVALTAARSLNLNQSITTNKGAITLTSGSDLTLAAVGGGPLSAKSTAGTLRVNGVIDGTTGPVGLTAGQDVLINQPVLNPSNGTSFSATAGRDVIVNAQIDGRGGASGGAVTLTASRDVTVNSAVVTNNGAIDITASNGAANMARGTALVSGSGSIAITAGSDVTTSGISGGSFAATSNGGSVNVNGVIDSNTGHVELSARRDVNINQPVLSLATGNSFVANAGNDINVNAPIDGTTAARGGSATLSAGHDVKVNATIATRNGAVNVSAAGGSATVGPNAGVFTGTGAIGMTALGNVTTGILSGGPMNIVSKAGSVMVSGPITGNGGAMTIGAGADVNVAHSITNAGTLSPLTITAGSDINVNAAIDGRTASNAPSSAVTLTAGQNVNLNRSINTQDAAISVTATQGTVTTAANQGLFAGSGDILVESGQTLSTGITSTTGALTLRSTNGSVNVDTAISGETGAVTIAAASDVNVNQAISNKRGDAPLSVSAGRDINVNATIDGRDAVLPGSSGTVNLTAGNNIGVNQSIVTRDSAITLTATNGTITAVGGGVGLFAGNATISETAGQTLNTGITETTGAVNLTSTGGGVNVNTAIPDTTGAVTINAATAVNINQAITNLKSGNNLAITAGTDINVLAQVDGRSGTAAGGAVTMTAGNNLNVTDTIATNNGAIALTATAGSVTLPVATETIQSVFDPVRNQFYDQIVLFPDGSSPMQASILAGNAPVTLTSGGNFTLTSPIKTTGALTITSTNGNVTTAAPIDDQTGVVTLTAGNALVVNREIRTNDQAITLNAGAGGITINQIDDHDYTLTSSVNPRNANLTLNSIGDVTILDTRGVATTQTLTIDTRGQIVTGLIGDALSGTGRPQAVVLNADDGIAYFKTGSAGSVTATSSGGSINLNVTAPGHLHVTTGTPNTTDCPTCDISITSSAFDASIGPDVVLNAGGSINMSAFKTTTADFTARSGDIKLDDIAIFSNSFVGTAGRDILTNNLLWVGQPPNAVGGGPLTLTAGRDIFTGASSQIHVSNGQTATFTANRNLTLYTLETLGAVDLTATTGNITLNTDIGGHIVNGTAWPAFNPGDLGVASLTMSAPAASAAINMQGARAEGNVVITSGGSLTAAKAITSVGGSVSITAPTQTLNQAIPIGSVAQVDYPQPVSPAIPPGPKAPLPSAPGVASGGGAGLPALTEIPVAAADQLVASTNRPGAAGGNVAIPGTPGAGNAPGLAGGSTTLPNSPPAPPVPSAPSTSVAGTDSASALRAADQGCGKESAQDGSDTGLNTIKPEVATGSADNKTPSCSATTPATTAPPAPAPGAPTTTSGTSAAASGTQGGGGTR